MIDIPISAATHTVISKEKFYQVSSADTKIKRLFVDEVEKITLRGAIAARTMNVSAGAYEELDIIEVQLKGSDVSKQVLETIDGVIPRPVLFVLVRDGGDTKYVISYKEPKAKELTKSKVIQYFETAWNADAPLIKGSSVKAIYINFIEQIDPSFDKAKPIAEAVAYTKQIAKIRADIATLNSRIKNEPSTAKRQELARERHTLEERLR